MNILQMSVSAALIAFVVIILRAAALDRLPKKTFLVLWGVVLLRLLVPFSVPSPFSVFGVLENAAERLDIPASAASVYDIPAYPGGDGYIPVYTAPQALPIQAAYAVPPHVAQTVQITHTAPAQNRALNVPPLTVIWLVGVIAGMCFFTVIYARTRRILRSAVPVADGAELFRSIPQTPRRRIDILQSDRITTPIAAGIFRPKVYLPASFNTGGTSGDYTRYILAHEYCHIERHDALWKLLFAAAVCIHWFNPLVWLMFWLFCRDLELACDEAVLRRFGAEIKPSYARALIGAAERRLAFTPLYSGFFTNAAEERIVSVMKYKKPTVISIILAALIVVGTTVAFATSGRENAEDMKSANDIKAEMLAEELVAAGFAESTDKVTVTLYEDFESVTENARNTPPARSYAKGKFYLTKPLEFDDGAVILGALYADYGISVKINYVDLQDRFPWDVLWKEGQMTVASNGAVYYLSGYGGAGDFNFYSPDGEGFLPNANITLQICGNEYDIELTEGDYEPPVEFAAYTRTESYSVKQETKTPAQLAYEKAFYKWNQPRDFAPYYFPAPKYPQEGEYFLESRIELDDGMTLDGMVLGDQLAIILLNMGNRREAFDPAKIGYWKETMDFEKDGKVFSLPTTILVKCGDETYPIHSFGGYWGSGAEIFFFNPGGAGFNTNGGKITLKILEYEYEIELTEGGDFPVHYFTAGE